MTPHPPLPDPEREATRYLSASDKELILAGALPRAVEAYSGGGGPMCLRYECRRNGVTIWQYTPDEWARECAWHLYWQQHGYSTTDPKLRASAPDEPVGGSITLRFTWPQVRAILEDQQLSLFR